MTEPTKKRVEARLDPASAAAAMEAAYQRRMSLNAWFQEAVDEKLEADELAANAIDEKLARR